MASSIPEIIFRKLTSLQVGTQVSLTCSEGGSGSETISGVVTENDCKDGITLLTPDGEEVVILYGDVRRIRTGKASPDAGDAPFFSPWGGGGGAVRPEMPGAVRPDPSGGGAGSLPQFSYPFGEAVSPVSQSLVPPPPAAGTPGPGGLLMVQRRDLSASLPALNASELKKLFGTLPKADKKKLQKNYDSFQYGIKSMDREKMAAAARAAERTLAEAEADDYVWGRTTFRLCGAMYCRTNIYRQDLYLRGRWYWEAAVCAYQTNALEQAAACAALAMLDTERKHMEDLLTILAVSACETGDLSGILLLWRQIPERMEPYLPNLFAALLPPAHRQSLQGISSAETRARLQSLYPKSAIASATEALLAEMSAAAKPASAPVQTPGWTAQAGGGAAVQREAAPSATRGWISRLNWGEQAGEITSGEAVLPFRYRDIKDSAFRKIVEEYPEPNPKTALWVSFSSQGGQAAEIAPAEPPLERARAAAERSLYAEAFDACAEAVGSPDTREALGDLVQYAVECRKSDKSTDALDRAADCYEKRREEYPSDAYHVAKLGEMYYELGDLASAVEYMRQALEFPYLNAKLKVTFLAHSIRYCVQYYNEHPDLDLMRAVRSRAEAWLDLYNGEMSRDLNCQRYYPRILRWKCRAECELDQSEEAEETYRALFREYPHDQHLMELRECIRAAKRRQPDESVRDAGTQDTGTQGERVQEDSGEPGASRGPDGSDGPGGPGGPADAGLPAEPETGGGAERPAGGGDDAPADLPAAPDTDGGAVPQNPEAGNAGDADAENAEAEEDDGDDGSGEDAEDGSEEGAEIPPYEDRDGWKALHMSKGDVVDLALGIPGPEDIPAALACLRAGANLNPDLLPLYRAAALAANDPLASPKYTVSSLLSMLESGDPDYPRLNDCCMGAAFLRASFLSGRDYSYDARAVRDSISIAQELPILRSVFDTLEEFRTAAGRAMDIYADYRNLSAMRLQEEMDAIVRRAEELDAKYIQSAPRENVRFKRLVETKKLLFARDGYLATMLRHVIDRDPDALDSEKDAFAEKFLNGSQQFSPRQISLVQVDALIGDCWEQVGKTLQVRRSNSTLQGDRRNNLRSNISEILGVLCQWYAVSEQGADMTWRTEEGQAAYQRLKPQLAAQLEELDAACVQAREESEDGESRFGLLMIAVTARELSARLNGSWRFEQAGEMYVPLLQSDWILLDESLMPDLSSTFCVLPEFNIFARIRAHIAERDPDWQAHLDRIYGPDRKHNNYGTADRILSVLRAAGQEDTVTVPENADLFVEQSALQAKMRFQGFLESYALARNYGQIMQSDDFCYRLEDTVRYWYAECCRTRNFGFFTSLIQQAEAQIHASARQYGQQLEEQLDALISSNGDKFDRHPGYAEAIRSQIDQQNFIVAEDWMHRIRLGDFSLEIQQPEALRYLEDFWSRYADSYRRVADTSRTLGSLLGRKAHNKDTKGAQRMIDVWLNSGTPSNPARMTQLLNFLGWQGVQVEAYHLAADTRTELYRVTREAGTLADAPLHPIAAFGSKLNRDGMYAVCLYGAYDCDRLYEKIRTLDALDGNKVVFLDYALGGVDRRALARKLKQRESGLRNVYLVVDRVLLCHLADVYNENLINRILMACAIPFSYCQPYVVESSLTMPPEIFIGRKDELLKIEQPDGVNLIYGGRQLGKSALFKKARGDLDGNQNRRAVLVDIKDCGCAAAARRLSMKLSEVGILPDMEPTEDWGLLCHELRKRLLPPHDDIRYLLVMLDEADEFIADCGRQGYRPIDELKTTQQDLSGQFKYVLAGLHNIVRFNREVALGRNSVITHLRSLNIMPFRSPEAQELLTGPLSYLGLSLPSKVTVSQILATVNYFPGLIQLYCQKLVESLRSADYAGYDVKTTPPYVITDDHLRRVMSDREFVEQIREKFEITLRLDQDQGGSYYPLALLIGWMYSTEPAKGGYSARDVLRSAGDLGISAISSLGEEKIDALMRELQDLNILRGVGEDTWLLASKNFRDLLGSDEEIFEKLSRIGEVAP